MPLRIHQPRVAFVDKAIIVNIFDCIVRGVCRFALTFDKIPEQATLNRIPFGKINSTQQGQFFVKQRRFLILKGEQSRRQIPVLSMSSSNSNGRILCISVCLIRKQHVQVGRSGRSQQQCLKDRVSGGRLRRVDTQFAGSLK